MGNIIQDLFKKTQQEMAFKEATDIFKNSKILKGIINQHLLKILMGPNYQDSP